jgi:hypothetical protein
MNRNSQLKLVTIKSNGSISDDDSYINVEEEEGDDNSFVYDIDDDDDDNDDYLKTEEGLTMQNNFHLP